MYIMFSGYYNLPILNLSSFNRWGIAIENILYIDDNMTNQNNEITTIIIITSDKNIKRYMGEGIGITCRIAPDSIILNANCGFLRIIKVL